RTPGIMSRPSRRAWPEKTPSGYVVPAEMSPLFRSALGGARAVLVLVDTLVLVAAAAEAGQQHAGQQKQNQSSHVVSLAARQSPRQGAAAKPRSEMHKEPVVRGTTGS